MFIPGSTVPSSCSACLAAISRRRFALACSWDKLVALLGVVALLGEMALAGLLSLTRRSVLMVESSRSYKMMMKS